MTDPGYSVHIVETRTGNIAINELPYLDTPQFTRALNDDGNIRVQIPVGDAGCPSPEKLRQLVTAWRYSLAICIGSAILAYGPIMTTQFDHQNSVLTIGAGSIWALLSRRWVIDPAAVIATPLSMATTQDANYSALELWGIAASLVTESLSRGAGFDLPIDIPTPAVGTAVRNYPVYDLANIAIRLKDLTQVQNGPDVDWDPYFNTSSNIRVTMRIGTPTLAQAGLDLIWDDESSITYLNVDSNSTTMSTSVLARGNQTERASQVAYSTNQTLVNAGWPQLEAVDISHQSVTDISTLQTYADEWVRFYRTSVEVWQVEVVTDVSPIVGTYKPGDHAQFNIQSHPWIPSGLYSQRILGWTQAGPNRLGLYLEATEGAV